MLTVIPAELFAEVSGVQTIDFSHNHLTVLPAGLFAKTTRVSILDLQSNDLAYVPDDAFSNMPLLTELYLNDNRLQSLPVLAGASSLEMLSMQYNRLTSLSTADWADVGSKITYLELSNNEITRFDTGVLSNLTAVAYLALNNNRLSSIPSSAFATMGNLGFLDLSSNLLEGDLFPALFPVWKSIHALNLSHNTRLTVRNTIAWNIMSSLDLSATATPLDPSMCGDGTAVIIRAMHNAKALDFMSMISSCLFKVNHCVLHNLKP